MIIIKKRIHITEVSAEFIIMKTINFYLKGNSNDSSIWSVCVLKKFS